MYKVSPTTEMYLNLMKGVESYLDFVAESLKILDATEQTREELFDSIVEASFPLRDKLEHLLLENITRTMACTANPDTI